MLKFFISRTFLLKVLPALGLYTLVMFGFSKLPFWAQWAIPLSIIGILGVILIKYLKKNPLFASMLGIRVLEKKESGQGGHEMNVLMGIIAHQKDMHQKELEELARTQK